MKAKTSLILLSVGLVSCGSESSDPIDSSNITPPATYSFESRFEENTSSVSYSGQTFRHLLIADLKSYMNGLTEDIDDQTFQPTSEGEVVAALETYLLFDSTISGSQNILTTTEPTPAQATYDDVSSGKNLLEKLAGKDSATDHRDWSAEFAGWTDPKVAENGGAVNSPEGLVRAFFETVETQALDRVNGTIAMSPSGEPLPVFVTPEGLDLVQLTEKFLLGSVAFSQGADDYLDDDVDGKGLLSSNTQDEDKPYTSLEHAWDEGFGYFGAARDYPDYSDEQISDGAHIDSDDSGDIDFTSECNFGASINAAKRDKGATEPTDLTKDAFDAFVTGRTIIANAGDELTSEEVADLKTQRDAAIGAWEKAIAATVIHYINDTLTEMDKIGSDDYLFTEHAKVWSEMKGFALGFQFNPRSELLSDFERLHELLRDSPTLDNNAEYRDDLLQARDLIRDAYDFSEENAESW